MYYKTSKKKTTEKKGKKPACQEKPIADTVAEQVNKKKVAELKEMIYTCIS